MTESTYHLSLAAIAACAIGYEAHAVYRAWLYRRKAADDAKIAEFG